MSGRPGAAEPKRQHYINLTEQERSPLMRASKRKRIAARDRRLAAIHEAGHILMARHLGAWFAFGHLTKNEPEGLDGGILDQKLWIGQTTYYFHKPASRAKLRLCWEWQELLPNFVGSGFHSTRPRLAGIILMSCLYPIGPLPAAQPESFRPAYWQ